MKKLFTQLIIVSFALLLVSCSSKKPASSSDNVGRYKQAKDAPPAKNVNVHNIPSAIPKDEPYSRYGNPASYVVFGKTYHVWDTHVGYEEDGLASWYGTKFHGYSTSSGEPYDMYQMSAAHKHLPIPSYAKVTNTKNNRSVIVKVNDRGPFHQDRIIDLSYAAAAQLGIIDTGTGHVRVESIDASGVQNHEPTPVIPIGNEIYLQVAAFNSFDSAHKLAQDIKSHSNKEVHVHEQGDLFRVHVGPFANEYDAHAYKDTTLASLNLAKAFVVKR